MAGILVIKKLSNIAISVKKNNLWRYFLNKFSYENVILLPYGSTASNNNTTFGQRC